MRFNLSNFIIAILTAFIFNKAFINIVFPELVIESFQYHPLYSTIDSSLALKISTVGNILFFLVGLAKLSFSE